MGIEKLWVRSLLLSSSSLYLPLLNLWVVTVNSLQIYPKETSTHLALSALSSLPKDVEPTEETIRAAAVNIIGQDTELPEEFDNAVGEL